MQTIVTALSALRPPPKMVRARPPNVGGGGARVGGCRWTSPPGRRSPGPRAEVAAFAADPGNAPRWYENIESVRWETVPPVAVGSRIAFVARFLGRRLAYTYEVRDLVPGERLVMSTAEGPFPMETTYTWADVGGGTRMTLRNRGEPAGLTEAGVPRGRGRHAPGQPQGPRPAQAPPGARRLIPPPRHVGAPSRCHQCGRSEGPAGADRGR